MAKNRFVTISYILVLLARADGRRRKRDSPCADTDRLYLFAGVAAFASDRALSRNHLWRDELDAEAFRVRLARIPPQFKPPRPIPLPPLDVEALKVEMEYMRADQPAVAVRDPNLESETTPPEIESPTAPLALREMAVGARKMSQFWSARR